MKLKRTLSSIKLRMVLIGLLCAVTGLWSEAQTINELGQLKVGETYTATKGKRNVGEFKSPATGKMTVTFKSGPNQVELYTSPDLEVGTLIEGKFNGNYLEPSTVYNVEEGKTYYVEVNLIIHGTDSKFILYMDGIVSQPFRATLSNPGTNGSSMYDMIYSEEMFIRFSKDIAEANEVTMTYTSNGGDRITKTLSPQYTRINNDYLFIRVVEALMELLADNTSTGISPRSPFTIKARVKDENGNLPENADKDGWLSYSYTCGYPPTRALSSNWPEQFLSYWVKGDESGLGKVTFTNDLRASGVGATLLMGNVEGEAGVDLYRAYVPAKVSGNTVTVDLTGVRRSLTDMMTNPTGTDFMSITITGLYDTNGQAVVSNNQGGVASHTVNLPYKDLGKGTVISDWEPRAGSNLAGVNEIEVWINGLNMIRFDGFTIEWTKGGNVEKIEIPMSEVKKSDESSDGLEAVFTFAVPEGAKTADAVEIYPTNLVSLNGFDYDVFLTALYNAFTFEVLDPGHGSEIANLQDKEIRATFNYTASNPEMFVVFSLKEDHPETPEREILIEETPMQKDPDGVYMLLVDKKMKLYQNHEYSGVFTAWSNEKEYQSGTAPIGTVVAKWYGATPAYQSSGIKLTGILPDEATDLIGGDGVFTVTFEGLVRIDGTRSYFIATGEDPQQYNQIRQTGDDYWTNPDDGRMYSTRWELVVPEKYIVNRYPDITIVFSALDEEGRVLAGNRGLYEDAYYEFNYQNTTGVENIMQNEEGLYIVYNLMGVRVMTTEDISALENLNPGIYIVNGKKVAIK